MKHITARERSRQDVRTPPELIEYVIRRYGPIGCDLAASKENAVVARYIDVDQDALQTNWAKMVPTGTIGWCNPPFGHINPWVARAAITSWKCRVRSLLLVPASLESAWYWNNVARFVSGVRVLRGRLKFPGYSNVAGQGHMLLEYFGGEPRSNHDDQPPPITVVDWREELDDMRDAGIGGPRTRDEMSNE